MPDNYSKPITILLADDKESQLLVLKSLFSDEEYRIISAKNGQQAVQLCIEQQPDLIILDVVMPLMDGLQAGTIIKQQLNKTYVPLIFITSSDNDALLQRCFDIGADDFIYKPLNLIALKAKVRSLLRIKRLYQEQDQQKKQLLDFQLQSNQEQEVASALYKNIIHAGFFNAPEVHFLLSPMALFNGDIFLVAKTPGNRLHILLGDFTGHGLSASVGAAPAAEIFYGMSEKGFGISEIVCEINRKMHKLLPVNMFLAATMLVIAPDTETISLIACGLPEHYLYNVHSKELQTISSDNLPLGIIESFIPKAQIFSITPEHNLYLFTDGVIEAENQLGQQFNNSGVIQAIRDSSDNGYQAVLAALDRHTKGLLQQDDITFVELNCNTKNAQWMLSEEVKSHHAPQAYAWKTSMEFHIDTLRHVNPVPVIIHSIMEIQGLLEHREAIFLILTELFANALEHGLLDLDSNLKHTSEGFMNYYTLREQRLNAVQDGVIKMHFNHQATEQGGLLVIKVQDTGDGFDFNKENVSLEQNTQRFGRGMVLLKNYVKV